MTAEEFLRRRRTKNLAVALAVAGLAVLFFVITVVRLMGAGHL
ncbi:MAG TPA: hypothetical protein VMQ11_08605 [Alphaproteobacteria bacterium]|nr:hypothetical protein [Alphaproteobacteria bacterium]